MTKQTPITSVPPACAALWAPYDVGVVPPYDYLATANVPAAPAVANHTSGAVSDADARRWAGAFNRQAAWYQWAEAAGQPRFLTTRLMADSAFVGPERSVLFAGGHISQPACDLYPQTLALFPIDATTASFLASHGIVSQGKFLFLATYPGPCTVTGTDASGKQVPIFSSTGPTTLAFAGVVVSDPVLGDVWKVDGVASCSQAGAPAAWCASP